MPKQPVLLIRSLIRLLGQGHWSDYLTKVKSDIVSFINSFTHEPIFKKTSKDINRSFTQRCIPQHQDKSEDKSSLVFRMSFMNRGNRFPDSWVRSIPASLTRHASARHLSSWHLLFSWCFQDVLFCLFFQHFDYGESGEDLSLFTLFEIPWPS